MKKKILVIVITLLVVCGIVFYFIPKYIEAIDNQRVYVYFTTRDISKGTVITADMVKIGDVSQRGLNFDEKRGILKASSIKDFERIVGQYVAYDMVAGEIIMKSKLGQTSAKDVGYMYNLGSGFFAYPIRTDLETTGAGILSPGDYIDLYAFTTSKNIVSEFSEVVRVGNGYILTSDKLRGLQILDLRNQMGSTADSSDGGVGLNKGQRTEQSVPRVIILKLDDLQIKELLKFESVASGSIKIAFRSRNPEDLKGEQDGMSYPAAYESGKKTISVFEEEQDTNYVETVDSTVN